MVIVTHRKIAQVFAYCHGAHESSTGGVDSAYRQMLQVLDVFRKARCVRLVFITAVATAATAATTFGAERFA